MIWRPCCGPTLAVGSKPAQPALAPQLCGACTTPPSSTETSPGSSRCRGAGDAEAAVAEMRHMDVAARLYFELHWADEDVLLSSEEDE